MKVLTILVAILGLAFLMVVHETGHYLLARFFGMRVIRFSIGFGPAIFKRQPKGSSTVYQIALIPFLAYVQVAGMNPFEESDPADKGSYANAKLHARILTIFAGPLANYLVASVLFFGALMLGGQTVLTTTIDQVMADQPAAQANLQSGDTILQIDNQAIHDWDQMRQIISSHPEQSLSLVVQRAGQPVSLSVTPRRSAEGFGLIGITPQVKTVPVSMGTAAITSLKEPPMQFAMQAVGIAHIIRGKAKAEFMGPIGMVKQTAKAVQDGFASYLALLGGISTLLAFFNLLPFPALDGGRLMFLAYEAATRKRPNARIEAHIHAVGLLMLLTLIVVISFGDIARPGP